MVTFIHRLFHNSTAPSHVKHVAVDRMTGDPGLPAAMPTRSFWLTADPDMNTDGAESALSGVSQAIAPPARLPETAEVAILGSGITSTSVARTLLRDGGLGDSSVGRADSGVVMLDAREPCGGATGRNGGHITEIGFGDYSELKAAVGQEEAMKIIRFRLVHLDTLLAVAKEEGLIEIGQVRRVVTATVIYDETVWEETKKALATFKEDFGEEAAEWQLVDSKRGLKVRSTPVRGGLTIHLSGIRRGNCTRPGSQPCRCRLACSLRHGAPLQPGPHIPMLHHRAFHPRHPHHPLLHHGALPSNNGARHAFRQTCRARDQCTYRPPRSWAAWAHISAARANVGADDPKQQREKGQ